MYCLQALLFVIQHSVLKESVHGVTSAGAVSDVEARRTESTNFASRVAPNNSSRGVVYSVIGTIRFWDDLDVLSEEKRLLRKRCPTHHIILEFDD